MHKRPPILHPQCSSQKMHSVKRKSSRLSLEHIKDGIANNNDLLIEILARLPVKSLLRFKSVSNRWLSLISSPDMSRRLCHDHHYASGLFLPSSLRSYSDYDFVSLSDKPIDAPFRSFTFDNVAPGFRILESCNGLLLCSSPSENYYIYNPTTKQFVTLPRLAYKSTTKQFAILQHVYGVNLAFDPAKSPHYKVVCVRSPDPDQDDQMDEMDEPYSVCQIEIYSSETRSWRLSGKPFPIYCNAMFRYGVFHYGALHWISTWGNPLYFNVDEEQLQEMPMPPIPEDWEERRYVYFGESRGHLHLVENYSSPTTRFDVYEMEKDYSRWFVKYRVDLDEVTAAFPEMIRSYFDPSDLHYYIFDRLCVARDARDEKSHLVLHIPGSILHYSLEEKTFRKICAFESRVVDGQGIHIEDSFRSFGWWGIYKFVESFSPV